MPLTELPDLTALAAHSPGPNNHFIAIVADTGGGVAEVYRWDADALTYVLAVSSGPELTNQTIEGATSFGYAGSDANITLHTRWTVANLTGDTQNVTLLNTGAPNGAVFEVRIDDAAENALTFFAEGHGELGFTTAVEGEVKHFKLIFLSGTGWRVLEQGDLGTP
jgi:hypothetical protein